METLFTRQGPCKASREEGKAGIPRRPRDVNGATLPGGKSEHDDADLWDTLNRELLEELGEDNYETLTEFMRKNDDSR